MTRPSRFTRNALTPAVALLLLAFTPRTALAEVFVGADTGLSILSQEGHAPPICCAERETWEALGGRVGGRVGYQTTGWFFARLDAGVALYQATTRDGHALSLVSPDVAFMLGAQARGERLTVGIALGAGWRRFSGSATSDRPGPSDYSIGESAPDLRLAIGVHRALGRGHRLGGELGIAKVMIAENVITLSLVYTWAGRG